MTLHISLNSSIERLQVGGGESVHCVDDWIGVMKLTWNVPSPHSRIHWDLVKLFSSNSREISRSSECFWKTERQTGTNKACKCVCSLSECVYASVCLCRIWTKRQLLELIALWSADSQDKTFLLSSESSPCSWRLLFKPLWCHHILQPVDLRVTVNTGFSHKETPPKALWGQRWLRSKGAACLCNERRFKKKWHAELYKLAWQSLKIAGINFDSQFFPAWSQWII